MSFNELSTFLNTGVGIIGIIVGIIGWRSLRNSIEIKNSINNVNNSTVQQVQTLNLNNGLDSYAVIKLSKETTKEELVSLVEQINDTYAKISIVEDKIDKQPKIHIGSEKPKESKNGDVWFQIEEKI